MCYFNYKLIFYKYEGSMRVYKLLIESYDSIVPIFMCILLYFTHVFCIYLEIGSAC